MALVFGDRVLETTVTTGTGPYALAGAVTGYQRFSAAATVGDTLYAAIFAVDGSGVPSGDWQAGLATYSATDELTFTSVTDSSTGGSAISFAAGTKWVIACPTAAYFAGLVDGGGSGGGGGGSTPTYDAALGWGLETVEPGSSGSTASSASEIEWLDGSGTLISPSGGFAFDTAMESGFDGAEAFDGIVAVGNGYKHQILSGSAVGCRVGYQFGSQVRPRYVRIAPIPGAEDETPESFDIVYRNDEGAFSFKKRFATTWPTDAAQTFDLYEDAAYVQKSGDTMTGPLYLPNEAYDATAWNGNLSTPVKDAIRDKFEAVIATIPVGAYVSGGTDVAVADGGTGSSTAAGARTNLSAAALSQTTECIAGFIATPANKDYRLVVKIPHGGTITETTTISVSGTCTATFKVNTTALGGTANSVSSGEQAQAHASSNTFAADDDIVLTVSSNSTCVDMTFSIKYTRTLE